MQTKHTDSKLIRPLQLGAESKGRLHIDHAGQPEIQSFQGIQHFGRRGILWVQHFGEMEV